MLERVLILAPRGRDAQVAAELLTRHRIDTLVCADLDGLLLALDQTAGLAILTEEALAGTDTAPLTAWIARQPPWSDFPFVMLANGATRPRTQRAGERLSELGNVVLLERPLHADAIIGAVRSGLKARRRQYESRDAAERLELAVAERTVELEAARATLELALNAAGMGTWDLDLVSGEATRSARHDEIFGYRETLEHWSLETFLAHVEPSARADIAVRMAEATRSGVLDIECPIIAADGTSRWIVAQGRVGFGPGQRPVRMTGVIADVTARKEADAQLALAQKMDAIGQLTGGVAHDFNNLLTPIVGALDLVRRRHGDDDKTQRLVGGALQAADRAAILTQRLLAFARRQALQPRAVDVGALTLGIVDLIRRSLGPTITVLLDVPPNLPSARVDPNQLELALLNLSINARDAMPGGGQLTIRAATVRVEARTKLGLEPGCYVRLEAEDTGIGMDRATLARATEPFFSTKGVGKGTGLGLSMVHGLAAQSGGALELHSEPGQGTSVALWLPATDEIASDPAAQPSEPRRAHRAATILLVDDEALVRTSTADMLRDIGYVVIEAASGTEALAALRDGANPDLLISDYLMPGMTGAQLIAELRADDNALPTLLVTGYAATGEDVPSDIVRLAKPFRQVDLAARVDDLLRQPASDCNTGN